ncbi:MAG: recombinase family protein [Candidatus Doudnabacteria bacterium]
MNCVIYLRVSTKEQAEKADSKEGYSIPAQRDACVKYIKEKGWELIDEYLDRGESARSAARPQLQEMLGRITKQKDVQVVVVHKIDRLARNMEDHITIKAILKRADTSLVSVVENFEDNASGHLVEGIHALMAEFYSANLGTETKKGMVQKAKQGGWPEMAPLGYLNVQTPMSGRLLRSIEVDEERAPFVQKAFELYATSDYSLKELEEELYTLGFRSKGTAKRPPGKVHKSRIANMLANPFYKGIVRWNEIETKGIHKPLIAKDLWDRVQEVIKVRDQAGERKRKHPHYLRGTVYCGECGSKMSSMVVKNRVKDEYTYFYCLGQNRKNGCKQKYIAEGEIEKLVEDCFKSIQLPENIYSKLKDRFEQELLKREDGTIREQQFITRRMTKLADQRLKLMEAYYAQAVPLEVLKKEQTRISGELEDCQGRLEVLKNGDDDIKSTLNLALDMASRCFEAYTKANPKVRRMFNQAFFKKVSIKNKKVSELHYTNIFALLFDAGLNKEDLVAGAGFEPATFGL